MGSRPQWGQVRSYKDTLKQLQLNPATWEDLSWNRPTWRRTVKAAAAIYEAYRITGAPDQPGRFLGPSNMPALSTHLPCANRPGQKFSDAMHQQSA
ncbi:unnamed protein product [Schistocephalus solidus]|uniref:Transposase n=1 Tax=Schistocephalus solidus TaxID=70667 RepID=A0A183SI76_SCHSO|nr:unnamed protein product [Schistocephalus solidus]